MSKKFWKATLLMVAIFVTAMLLLPACVTTETVTVDFESNGGTEVASLTVGKGEAFDPPTAPRKPGYTFDGWYKDAALSGTEFDFSGVSEDTTLYAKWTINRYTYTFYADDGTTVIKTETLDYGAAITPPANPTKAATAQYTYTFTGWGKAVPATLTDNIDFTAAFSQTVNKYTYTFYAEDGVTVLETKTLDYGSAITPPANPTKPATTQYTYTFAGWGKTVPATLTENITFTAAFSQSVRKYTYTFYADDGVTVLETKTLDYGSAITPPENPTKPATAQYTYTFTAWDKDIPATLTQNITFTAVFSQTLRTYTYTFYAEDGVTVLKTETLDYGSAITPPAAPTKPATAQYTYTFAGWGKDVPATLTGDIEFTAAFSETVNQYTYTFYDGDGVTVMKAETADYGSQIVPPDTDKAQTELYTYVFDGWDKEIPAALTQDIDFTAYYIENKRVYKISFEERGGEEVTDIEAVWGTAIDAPDAPERPGYQFECWQDAEGEDYVFTVMPVGGITLYAQWTANINALGFDGNGGDGFMESMDIPTDETVTLPDNTFDRAGFTFEGWAVSAGGQVEYADGASYTMGALSSYTLYAVWKANTNELFLEPNGAWGTAISLNVDTYQTITLPAMTYRHTGYTFLGWAETWDGETVYADQAEYTMGTEELYVLYAVWEAMPGTEGLMYNLINYGTEYEVVGIGTASGDIVVPAYYEGLPVTKIGYAAFFACEDLTGIIISDGVTAIDGMAFKQCENLSTAELPETLQEIGVHAFSESGLTSIRLPDSLVNLGHNAFYRSHLTSIRIPKLANISGQAFGSCLALAAIDVDEENNSYRSIDGVLFDKSGAILLTYPAGKSNLSYTVPADVTTISDDAFYDNGYLRSLSFDGWVTSIGAYAFTYCISLTDIDLHESVESIGMGGFAYCSSLTSVTLPAAMTEISEYLFLECANLQSVVALGSLTDIGYGAFQDCMNLESFIIPASVGYVSADAFKNCPALTIYCELPQAPAGWDAGWNPDPVPVFWLTDGVKREYTFVTNGGAAMDAVFDYFVVSFPETEKPGYVIENWYTDELFSGSPVTFPYFSKTELTLYVKWMPGTAGLAYTLINGGNEYAVSGIGTVTDTDIVIPAAHLGLPVTAIGIGAFSTSGLTSVVITEGIVTVGNGAFFRCGALTSVELPAGLETLGTGAFAATGLTSLLLPDGLLSISNSAFSECVNLESVVIPASVTFIGNLAFIGCVRLKIVTVPAATPFSLGGGTGNIAFNNVHEDFVILVSAEALTAYKAAPGWSDYAGKIMSMDGTPGLVYTLMNEDSEYAVTGYIGTDDKIYIWETYRGLPVTAIGDEAFFECYWLTSVSLPEGIRSIGDAAFKDCSDLASFVIPGTVITIGEYAFSGCYTFTEIMIPESVQSLGAYAFEYCSMLESASLPASMTSIPEGLFSNCAVLSTFTFSAGLLSIGAKAFEFCELTGIDLPAGLTSIGEEAFANCSNLTVVDIPASVTEIGRGAFFGCVQLTEITVDAANTAYKSVDGILYNRAGTLLHTYPAGKEGTYYEVPASVTVIYDFANNEYIEEIVLPENLTAIGDMLFFGNSNLASINLPAGITSIGNAAFYDCESITAFELPEGLVSIDEMAFLGCTGLVSVSIPESVMIVGMMAFYGCTETVIYCEVSSEPETWDSNWNLFGGTVVWGTDGVSREYTFDTAGGSEVAPFTGINIPAAPDPEPKKEDYILEGWYTDASYAGSAVTFPYFSEINLTLYAKWTPGTGGLTYRLVEGGTAYEVADSGTAYEKTSIYIPSSHLGLPVIGIGQEAFIACVNLVEVVLPEGITYIDSWAFCCCFALRSVTLPSSLLRIGLSAFDSCESLPEVVLPEGLMYLDESAFAYCYELVSVTFPSSLVYIGENAFEDCGCLTGVILPEGLEEIAEMAFSYCYALDTIEIPASVTTIGAAPFAGCMSLTYIGVAEGSTSFQSIDGVLYDITGTILIHYLPGRAEETYTLPESVTEIGPYAFYLCPLSYIVIPAGIEKIGVAAFSECESLQSVVFESGSHLTVLEGNAFGYSGIEEIVIPEGVQSIGAYAFSHCESLISATIPASVTNIGNSAFTSCLALQSITFAEGSLLEEIGSYAFSRTSALEEIQLPAGLTTIGESAFRTSRIESIVIPASVETIASTAFSSCQSLASLTFAAGSMLKTIGNNAFEDCLSLTNITLPSSLETIGEAAFIRCNGLVSVNIAPEGALTAVNQYAFYNCPLLNSVVLPQSLTLLGMYAFSICPSLRSVTIYAPTPPDLFLHALEPGHTSHRIYVPAAYVGIYQATWTNYAALILPIPEEV